MSDSTEDKGQEPKGVSGLLAKREDELALGHKRSDALQEGVQHVTCSAAKPQAKESYGVTVSTGILVKSAMAGVVYVSPSPDSPPFVEIGARIRPGDDFCLIEAMKVFAAVPYPGDCDAILLAIRTGLVGTGDLLAVCEPVPESQQVITVVEMSMLSTGPPRIRGSKS